MTLVHISVARRYIVRSKIQPASRSLITDHQAKYFATQLTINNPDDGVGGLSRSLFDASVDLNPHQINAALFALENPLSQGVILADEVGLGKTIEAGLVLSQFWAEFRRRIIIICPASLRKQWEEELRDKFNLSSQILDSHTYRENQSAGIRNPLNQAAVIIMSFHYASSLDERLLTENWDLVVIDEAHNLRNSYRESNKMGQKLRRNLSGRKKLLLTATPLQNSLLELYGLSTLIDPQLFGTATSFKKRYVTEGASLSEFKKRMAPYVHRTLRKDVMEYIRYTDRQTLTVPFTPTNQEQILYERISDFFFKEETYVLPQRQRHLMRLILRKLLASSSRAIMYTLEKIRTRLENMLHNGKLDETDFSSFMYDEGLAGLIDSDSIEESVDHSEGFIDKDLVKEETQELTECIELAKSIKEDSKAKALLLAIEQGFSRLLEMGAPRKIIIFTESVRTQEYLFEFLSNKGFSDKLVTFNGANKEPLANVIYKSWLNENKYTNNVTGSVQSDKRAALIDCFRNSAEIMIATEAAAEGVNLQFCSLLVNYDLPWNPQRLNLRIKPRRRIKRDKPDQLSVPTSINQVWSMDFMSDSLGNGNKLRTFNVMDDYNREGLAIEVDRSLPSARVIRALEQVIQWRGKPAALRCDNGPEYISNELTSWANANQITLLYIQPGKPTQNAYIERFNRTARHEWLDMHIFNSIEHAQLLATQWLWIYNNVRPHSAINGITPIMKLKVA